MAPFRSLVVLLGVVSLSQAAELTTLDGKKISGEIAAIGAKSLIFHTPAGDETFEITKLNAVDIASVKEPVAGTKWIEVELIDGSQFRCSDFKIKGKLAVLTLLGSNIIVELQSSTILYMVRDLADLKVNQAFRAILAKRGKRDIWIVQKPDESIDGVNGTFGDGDAKGEVINFELEANAEKLNIQLSRIYGMIFNPPPIPVAQTLCKVIDANKNVLYAKSVIVNDQKSLTVESVTGVKVEYPKVDSIARLDFSAGSVLYLSNAEPIKVEQSSTEGVAEPYRRDRNLDNTDLKINQVRFAKGLALHSRTVLTYDLGGKYKLFQATAAVDDCVDGESKVTLTVEADFKPLFKEVIKRGDKPKVLNLAMLNVNQLRITVESELLDLGNQVDLLDAKLLK